MFSVTVVRKSDVEKGKSLKLGTDLKTRVAQSEYPAAARFWAVCSRCDSGLPVMKAKLQF
jgi:hypothetical protein